MTFHHEPSGKWACRYCAHWFRREQGEDCTQGRLMRQKYCRSFEREVGTDDDLDPEDADMRGQDAV